PMFSLAGVARYLFVPLAEAVMFAVISSYVLSRTLVPTMIMFFERHHHKQTGENHVAFWVRPLVALQQGFEKAFDRFREAYANLLGTVLGHRAAFAVGFLSFALPPGCSFPFSGKISFRRWTQARFDCTCGRRPGRGSSKRPSWLTKWKPPFVIKFPRMKWRVSSTTSDFRFLALT